MRSRERSGSCVSPPSSPVKKKRRRGKHSKPNKNAPLQPNSVDTNEGVLHVSPQAVATPESSAHLTQSSAHTTPSSATPSSATPSSATPSFAHMTPPPLQNRTAKKKAKMKANQAPYARPDLFGGAEDIHTSTDPDSLPRTGPGFIGKRFDPKKENFDSSSDNPDILSIEDAGQDIPDGSTPFIVDLIHDGYRYVSRTEYVKYTNFSKSLSENFFPAMHRYFLTQVKRRISLGLLPNNLMALTK